MAAEIIKLKCSSSLAKEIQKSPEPTQETGVCDTLRDVHLEGVHSNVLNNRSEVKLLFSHG